MPMKPTGASTNGPVAIVGLGASAGGLEALRAFFLAMPAGSGVAFVVVQHMLPDAKSLLPDLLAKTTAMPVRAVEDGMAAAPDHVYVVPPGRCLRLEGGVLRLEAMREEGVQPIDAFFGSLAADRQETAVAIVLSGTASDGTLGLKAIKERGGLALAQDPASAHFDGMPRSAIRSGLVDAVIAPALMPEVISRFVRNLAAGRPHQEPIQAIIAFICARTKHDFRHYKKGTVVRRIQRRMALRAMDTATDYLALLQQDPAELAQLHQDLLIGVTRFFRDADAFALLVELGLRPLLAERDPDDPIRVWAPGCSSGEEAYSLAITLAETMEALGRDVPFKIFATDIDARALEAARSASFPEAIGADVSPARLERFFVRTDGGWQVGPAIREAIVFAEQNLVGDPPFHKLDLVVCRNVLIYLEPELQKKVLSLFHFALKPGGLLFLGPSEAIGGREDLFTPLSKKWRLFARVDARNPADYPIAALDPPRPRPAT